MEKRVNHREVPALVAVDDTPQLLPEIVALLGRQVHSLIQRACEALAFRHDGRQLQIEWHEMDPRSRRE